MPRFASIDIGTNSVLLLVADRGEDGRFTPVVERAEITRLGRGVDQTKTLSAEGITDTLRVVTRFAQEARTLGTEGLAVSATSAARDASNGAEFIARAKSEADVTIEIITGELEAQLSFSAVQTDFPDRPLVVIDIGGGSTEFIHGDAAGKIHFRHSFDVGSVRLTERFVHSDPPTKEERAAIENALRETFRRMPQAALEAEVVGVAGTVTTLYTITHEIEPYDPALVQGGELTLSDLRTTTDRLFSLPLEQRRALPGLQPKRADVICAGALVLLEGLKALGVPRCRVSDRGLRWGLLAHHFGGGGVSRS